jgi:ketosteroid isomerase-like protein
MDTQSSPNAEADEAVLKSWFERYCAIVGACDFDAYRTLWTEDVIFMPPNGPRRQGIDDCVAVNQFYFEEYHSVEKHFVEEIEVADRFAYVRVEYTYEGTSKTGGAPLFEDGKALFILKRAPDGSWLATHMMWNSDLPPA